MFYNYLKIFHIISAALVLMSIIYSYQLWRAMQKSRQSFSFFTRIQRQTALIIVPGSLIQLATGFSLINIQHVTLTAGWVETSIAGFILLISCWLGFMYFLVAGQQQNAENSTSVHQSRFYQKAQSFMLLLCGLALSVMIYSMANRIAPLYTGVP